MRHEQQFRCSMPNFSKSGGSRRLTPFPLDFELAVDLDSSTGQAFHARIMLIHLTLSLQFLRYSVANSNIWIGRMRHRLRCRICRCELDLMGPDRHGCLSCYEASGPDWTLRWLVDCAVMTKNPRRGNVVVLFPGSSPLKAKGGVSTHLSRHS